MDHFTHLPAFGNCQYLGSLAFHYLLPTGDGPTSAAKLCWPLGCSDPAGHSVPQPSHSDCCPKETQLHPRSGTCDQQYLEEKEHTHCMGISLQPFSPFFIMFSNSCAIMYVPYVRMAIDPSHCFLSPVCGGV